jgi:hypothetical protein
VAERLGGETEMISDLCVDPTAIFPLAVTRLPTVLHRVEVGERVTAAATNHDPGTLRTKPMSQAGTPAGKSFPSQLLG